VVAWVNSYEDQNSLFIPHNQPSKNAAANPSSERPAVRFFDIPAKDRLSHHSEKVRNSQVQFELKLDDFFAVPFYRSRRVGNHTLKTFEHPKDVTQGRSNSADTR